MHHEGAVADDGDAGQVGCAHLSADHRADGKAHRAHRQGAVVGQRRRDHHVVQGPPDAVAGVDEDVAVADLLVEDAHQGSRIDRVRLGFIPVRPVERRVLGLQPGDEPTPQLGRVADCRLDARTQPTQLVDRRADVRHDAPRHRKVAADHGLIQVDLDERPLRDQRRRIRSALGDCRRQFAEAGSEHEQGVVGAEIGARVGIGLAEIEARPRTAAETVVSQRQRMGLGEDALGVRRGHHRNGKGLDEGRERPQACRLGERQAAAVAEKDQRASRSQKLVEGLGDLDRVGPARRGAVARSARRCRGRRPARLRHRHAGDVVRQAEVRGAVR